MAEPADPANGSRIPPPAARGPGAGDEFDRLVAIMRALRSPDGCPWDRQQTLRTLAPYVQEEAAEVVDAIERDDTNGLRDEIGDLLFEGVFLAQLTSEAGHFTAADAVRAACEKLIRRHPHVFEQPVPPGASEGPVETPSQVVEQWYQIKAREKPARDTPAGLLDGIPAALPALVAANQIGRRVARVGFDWPGPRDVIDKIAEELDELRDELPPRDREGVAAGAPIDRDRVAEELGDLLFSVAQLARALDLDPEAVLRAANRKFRARFGALEAGARADGIDDLSTLTLAQMERRWQAVKDAER
jgi:MazG family protein